MASYKDLGQDVVKSMDDMKKLRESLKSLRDMTVKLKKGLREKKLLEGDIVKDISSAREQATALDNTIEAIMDSVRSIKMDGNSRFMNKSASQRVIANFLDRG